MSKINALVDQLIARQNLKITSAECLDEILEEMQKELQEKQFKLGLQFRPELDSYKLMFGNYLVNIDLEEIEKKIRQNDRSKPTVRDIIENLMFEKLGF